jgi:hypothetical protein
LPYEKIYPVKSDEVGATQFNRVNPVQSLPQQPPLEARANKIQSATPAQPAAQTKPHTAGPAPQQLPANQQPGDVKQSPYIIRPVFGNTEDTSSKKKPLPKNVVNLKDNFFQE